MRISDTTTINLFNYTNQTRNTLNQVTSRQLSNIADTLKYDKIGGELRSGLAIQNNLQDQVSMNQIKEVALSTITDLIDELKDVASSYQSNYISQKEKSSLLESGKKLFKEIQSIFETTTFDGKKVFDDSIFDFLKKTNTNQQTETVVQNQQYEQTKNVPEVGKELADEVSQPFEEANIDESSLISAISGDLETLSTPTFLKNMAIASYQTANEIQTETIINEEMPLASTQSSIEALNEISNNEDSSILENTQVSSTESPIKNLLSFNSLSSSLMSTQSVSTQSISKPSDKYVYEINAPTYNIPDQGDFTGYREIKNDAGVLIYKGFLYKGQFNGHGTLYNEDGTIQYQGDWKKGAYDDWGTAYYQDGSIQYQGFTNKGVPNGWGIYNYQDGSSYQGTFKKGYRQGLGTTTFSNGQNETKYYLDYKKYGKTSGSDDDEIEFDDNDNYSETNPSDNDGDSNINNENNVESGNNNDVNNNSGDSSENIGDSGEENTGNNGAGENVDNSNGSNLDNSTSSDDTNTGSESGLNSGNTGDITNSNDTNKEGNNQENGSSNASGNNNIGTPIEDGTVQENTGVGNGIKDSKNTGENGTGSGMNLNGNEGTNNRNNGGTGSEGSSGSGNGVAGNGGIGSEGTLNPYPSNNCIPDNKCVQDTCEDEFDFMNLDWIRDHLEKPIKDELRKIDTNQFILESRLRYRDRVNEINEERMERLEAEDMAKKLKKQFRDEMLNNLSMILKLHQYHQEKEFLAMLLNP